MKSNTLKLVELDLTIPAPPVGATEHLLSHYLRRLVEGITALPMDMLKSVEADASSYRLSITVSATGDLQTKESSTSRTQHGYLLPMNHSVEDSSKLPSEATMGMRSSISKPRYQRRLEKTPQVTPSQTQQWNTPEYSLFCDHMGELMLDDKQLTVWGAAYLTHIWMGLEGNK